MSLLENSLSQFAIFSWQDLARQAHFETFRFLEVTKDPNRKDLFIRGNTKICPVLEVKVTKHFDRHGIEIMTDCMQKDGTQSWIVISRDVNKYVTELPEENKKLVHYEAASSSTEELVAMKQKEQRIQSSSSSTALPINQRKWNDTPAFGRIDGYSYKI